MDRPPTKDRIMDAAIVLFSDKGCDKVSMRDIAAEVGIKAASIYNHFPSKQGILKNIYKFFAEEHHLVFPKIEELLYLLETGPVDDVFAHMCYYYRPEIQDKMDRIFLIASQRLCLDKDSENFIKELFFVPLTGIWTVVLNRGIELGKINAIDVDVFVKLITCYAFSSAELNRTEMKITLEQWNGGLEMLYSLLRPEANTEQGTISTQLYGGGKCLEKRRYPYGSCASIT